MTDQASSGNGQHQRWVASSKQQSADGGSGCWQQGGSRVETLSDHGRCCLVGLLGCLPLTDGVCDDVLDVVEGITGETVIELMCDVSRLEMYRTNVLIYRTMVL
jgi:hypothetical protein